MKKKVKAYLTVYLSVCLSIVLSLYLVLIDGVRRNGARLEAACVAEAGLQSVMAEYHRELFRQYGILAVDSSYGTEKCGKQNTEEHLSKFLNKNLETDDVFLHDFFYRDFFELRLQGVELTHVSILTDVEGAVFRKCAVEAVKDEVGIGFLEKVQNWIYTAEINGLNLEGIQTERDRLNGEWRGLQGQEVEISEKESVVIDIPNPMEEFDEEKQKGFLGMVIKDTQNISKKAIATENSISERMKEGKLNTGNMLVDDTDLWERLLFQEYLIRKMGNYREVDLGNALEYQVEYILNGKGSDVENLKGTAYKLCALRETANLLYLMSCEEKRTQAKNVATIICGLLRVPNLTQLMESIIILGWAAAESIYDVKALFDGGKIPLIKDDDSWHYGLKTSFQDSMFGAIREDDDKGLEYTDYLRIIMAMTALDKITARAMDMVEADIRLTPGNRNFRLDACYDRLYAVINLRSEYGYEMEISQKKEYR